MMDDQGRMMDEIHSSGHSNQPFVMTAERWSRVQALFFQAIELPADEQAVFLRRECANDAELFDEVSSLVAAEAPDLFEDSALARLGELTPTVGATLGAADSDPLAGGLDGQVGPYRIIRRLGAGGMGTVYLAERADGQFDQTVALKLVKRGMDTDAVVGRFQAERQILARLEHPNIARLLDGGVHTDGRPFFALEYVDGEAITDYCDARSLSIDERLALFENVCEAVAYAHRNLIVHRDLKPSNILVRDEPAGSDETRTVASVKLLDFGIAKLLTDNADDLLTRTGERILTPAYAAPEQLTGAAITTATDVYGLGVVLYELLTGTRPSAFGTSASSLNSAGDTKLTSGLRRSEKPSSVVSRSTEQRVSAPNKNNTSGERIASRRSTTPDRLRRRLKGDLDTIVMAALREEPERRYASARDLLSDLRAFREDRPVSAQPESTAYRLRKYVKRHRTGVATVATAVLGLAIITAVYTVRLTAERDRARLEAQKSSEVSEFLRSLFAISDPRESGGEQVTARELLDRGATRIESELSDQPEVQSQMMNLIGEVYSSLGSYDRAERILTETLALRRRAAEPSETEIASTLVALGLLYERQGRYREAVETQQEAVDLLRTSGTDTPLQLADALHALSFLKMRLGDFTESEAIIREALAIKQRHLPADDPDVAYSLNILGDALTQQGRYAEAEAVHHRALDIRRKKLGDAHLDVAYSLHNLGATLRDQRRWAEAEKYYREAMAVWRRHYGYDNQESANTLSQLALVVGMQGRYEESDSLQNIAIDMAIASVGPDHPKVSAMYIRSGDVAYAAAHLAEAEARYRTGIETHIRVLGDTHPYVTKWRIRLGRIVAEEGRLAEGRQLVQTSAARCSDPSMGGYDGCADQAAAAETFIDSLSSASASSRDASLRLRGNTE